MCTILLSKQASIAHIMQRTDVLNVDLPGSLWVLSPATLIAQLGLEKRTLSLCCFTHTIRTFKVSLTHLK